MGEARGGRMQTGHSKWAKTLMMIEMKMMLRRRLTTMVINAVKLKMRMIIRNDSDENGLILYVGHQWRITIVINSSMRMMHIVNCTMHGD